MALAPRPLAASILTLCTLMFFWSSLGALAEGRLRIGFLDLQATGEPRPRNAAALAYARTQGDVTRLQPLSGGGLLAPGMRVFAPEEFDVLWYHQGEDATPGLSGAAVADLRAYVQGGGALLLSGAAGELVHEMDIEPTAPRVLGTTAAAYTSGIIVTSKHRAHPIFAGFDITRPILLTSLGGNALADFYGTPGPHGELLADGNAGLGERPLVEYTVGAGRIIFVGWRLPDFTTDKDPYRPNLERLFHNMLQYLADANTNRGRMALPPGKATYARVLGVPFLRGEAPADLSLPAAGMQSSVVLTAQPSGDASLAADGWFVTEAVPSGDTVSAQAFGLTVLSRQRPASTFLAALRAEQEAQDQRDAALMKGLRILKPDVTFTPAPLKPLQLVEPEQSVLLGRSAFMAPGDGLGRIEPPYEPLEDGGFRITGSSRRFNRPIVHGQNRVWTGDAAIFRVDAPTGQGCYSQDRIFPLFPRPDASQGQASLSLGTLRLGVPGADGKVLWLDDIKADTSFRPGYTEYRLSEPSGAWNATLVIAPLLDSHGFVCRVEFDREVPLQWEYGGLWWQPSEANRNRVELGEGQARITEPNLPNALVCVGWDGKGAGATGAEGYGQKAQFTSTAPQRVYHIVQTWGVTTYDQDRAQQTLARLDTPNADQWAPGSKEHLKALWFDAYIGRALEPERRFQQVLGDPEQALSKTRNWWDARRQEFQIRTPDPRLNALINWSRATTEYHRQGPGLVLGAQIWQMYSHISTGWYGKQWGGDHQAMEECLRFYGAMQADDGFIRWISPSLVAFNAENNTPYWVDQVWRHFTWTGDVQFLRDLWPAVRKAVAWMRAHNDPDDDGLFRDFYEYWNCDSNGKGPKSVVPSAMSWAMLDRAAQIAKVLGDGAAQEEYRALADRTRTAIFRELWREDKGRLGCIGGEGIWRGHPQTWEEYLPINAGLLSPEQGRSAMRWLAAHYGFEPQPGVKLLACSDWYPIRWSCQWVPTGDTCLACLAGMKCGDADLWWPYLKTVVGSAFHSDFPGINMGISNAGAGGGDREDVDSVDPHVHVAVRGLFGIEPALHEGRLDICPAFPSDWTEASIRTPDVSYEWERQGNTATFRIHTPKPLVKRVRANLTGPEVVTPAETDSVVRVSLGPPPPPLEPPDPATQTTFITFAPLTPPALAKPIPPLQLPAEAASRQVLFDLSVAYNCTPEEFVATRFLYDCQDNAAPIAGWWGNPGLAMPPSPRVVEAPGGVRFLTAGRRKPGLGAPSNGLLALSSWPPYPLPAGATLPVGLRCERLWLLLQSYVHPMKNYIPNGEVVLRYADGQQTVVSLIPPYNLDCYFQHFSLQGVPVPLGRSQVPGGGFSFVPRNYCEAHADALEVPCDPARELASVELRATCTEGALGLVGMTALAAAP